MSISTISAILQLFCDYKVYRERKSQTAIKTGETPDLG
jgi:hypothetical protein